MALKLKKRKFSVTGSAKIKASGKAAKQPRFSCIAYTGAAMKLDGFDLPVVIDLAGMTTHSQARPALLDHCTDLVAGQSDAIRILPTRLEVDGFNLRSTEAGREVLSAAAEGFIWQMSVGCDIPEESDIEEIAAGESIKVNGQTHVGPLYIARRTVLGEVSFVVMGADDRTSARIAARRKAQLIARKQTMKKKTFEEWVASMKLDVNSLSDDQKTAMQEQYDALPDGESDDGDDGDDEEDDEDLDAEDEDVEAGDMDDEDESDDEEDAPPPKAKAKSKKSRVHASRRTQRRGTRVSAKGVYKQVTAAAAKANRRIAAIQKAAKGDADIVGQALEKGWGTDRVKNEVELKKLRAGRAGAPGAQQGAPLQINAKVMEASLLLNIGTDEKSVGKHFDQKTMNIACSRDWQGCSLHVLMDQVIEASGESYRGSRKSDSFIRAAARANAALQVRASGGYSTVNLSNILENVANKVLLESYEAQETIWRNFCAIRPLNDFKIHSYYRLDMNGAFKRVGQDGELQHLKPTDAKFTNQLETYGAQLVLTRQMQINDDLNAFATMPKAIGRLAQLRPEEAFIVLLLSNLNNFFHTDNRNKLTGAGSALGIPGLTAAKTAFKAQVDSNGKPILVTPDRILSGSTLSVMAENLNVEQTLVGGTTNDKLNRNPHKGKYAPSDTPYIDNDAVTDQDGKPIAGQSSTLWYLFCDPNVRAAFAMGFLNGNQTPFFRSKEAETGILGTAFESFMDFGVGQEDPFAALMNVGA